MNKKEELELTIEALKSMRTRTTGRYGICNYFFRYNPIYLGSYMLKSYFRSWDKFSGDVDYPVPASTLACPVPSSPLASLAYEKREDMWNKATQYGSDRYELLEHCITEATKELEQLNES